MRPGLYLLLVDDVQRTYIVVRYRDVRVAVMKELEVYVTIYRLAVVTLQGVFVVGHEFTGDVDVVRGELVEIFLDEFLGIMIQGVAARIPAEARVAGEAHAAALGRCDEIGRAIIVVVGVRGVTTDGVEESRELGVVSQGVKVAVGYAARIRTQHLRIAVRHMGDEAVAAVHRGNKVGRVEAGSTRVGLVPKLGKGPVGRGQIGIAEILHHKFQVGLIIGPSACQDAKVLVVIGVGLGRRARALVAQGLIDYLLKRLYAGHVDPAYVDVVYPVYVVVEILAPVIVAVRVEVAVQAAVVVVRRDEVVAFQRAVLRVVDFAYRDDGVRADEANVLGTFVLVVVFDAGPHFLFEIAARITGLDVGRGYDRGLKALLGLPLGQAPSLLGHRRVGYYQVGKYVLPPAVGSTQELNAARRHYLPRVDNRRRQISANVAVDPLEADLRIGDVAVGAP